LGARVYNRMNNDYRLLHDFCRLFLGNRAITEHAGDWQFPGFLLDMNVLFEDFVTVAFSVVARRTPFFVYPQKEGLLSEPTSMPIRIQPDVSIYAGTRMVAIVDAKYKRLDGPVGNADIYQMLAYGTALQCSRTYLFYPTAGWDGDTVVDVRHSSVTIHIRQIDVGHPQCVAFAEQAARTVLNEASKEVARALQA
jgi:5-methylcytosine-specific restriction enzyme subunit McrC